VQAAPVVPPTGTCTADPVLNPNGNRILPFVWRSVSANEFTPSVTLDFKPVSDVLTYVSYSKGFKSGGFTQRVFPPEPAASPFAPEFVTSYEAGVKSELFGRRVRWNSAAFYMDYTEMQLIVNEGLAPKVRNAGKATIRGLETEFEVVASDRVRLNGGVGLTDGYYDSVPASVAGVTLDSRLPNAPKWTGMLGIAADAWSGRIGKVSINADWSYKGTHYLDAVNSSQLRQGGYGLLGASVQLQPDDAAWSVSLGGSNLANKAYLSSGYQDLTSVGAVTGTYGRPREWYVRGSVSLR
jgi:iron complex outermembrane receptor protein